MISDPVVEVAFGSHDAETKILQRLQVGYKLVSNTHIVEQHYDCEGRVTSQTNEFLLVFENESFEPIDHWQKEVNKREETIKKKCTQIYELKDEIIKKKKLLESWERDYNTRVFEIKHLGERIDKMNDKIKNANLLEQDLVKVRNAIGEIKFTQIVGDKEEEKVNPQFP